MKTWTIIIWIIVVIAVIWLGYWLYQNYSGGPALNTTNNTVNNTSDNTAIDNTLNNLVNNIIPPVGQTKEVLMSNLAFNPKTLTVAVGTTVIFKNNDSVAHTVTFAQGTSSGSLATGSSFSRTFDTKGTFNYHCSIHPTMTGSITVQ